MSKKLQMDLQYFGAGEPNKGATDPEVDEDNSDEDVPLTKEAIEKMIQSENDKVRTHYTQQLKDLQEKNEALEKEKMSDEEQRQYDLDQMSKTLEQKEAEIRNRELTIKTVDLLKEKDLPLEFREFVIGKDEEETATRVETFGTLWVDALKDAVDTRFKEGGRDIQKGTDKSTHIRSNFLDMANEHSIRK